MIILVTLSAAISTTKTTKALLRLSPTIMTRETALSHYQYATTITILLQYHKDHDEILNLGQTI
jgi:hypothetical protein